MDGRCAAHARAGFGNSAHHQSRLEDAEAESAVFLREADAQPAILRERGDKFLRKATVAVTFQPVIVAETAAYAGDGGDDALLLPAQIEIHSRTRGLPSSLGAAAKSAAAKRGTSQAGTAGYSIVASMRPCAACYRGLLDFGASRTMCQGSLPLIGGMASSADR